MFLDILKNYFAKKKVKKSLLNVKHIASNGYIKTIGLLVDESFFAQKAELIHELIKHGFLKENIKLLVFKDSINKTERNTYPFPIFSNKDLSWSATFENREVNSFMKEKFDLLISYYNKEKTPLLQVTCLSNADFKVGFACVDKRLNDFMIDIDLKKHQIFTQELIRYLKILKKI